MTPEQFDGAICLGFGVLWIAAALRLGFMHGLFGSKKDIAGDDRGRAEMILFLVGLFAVLGCVCACSALYHFLQALNEALK